MTHADILKTVLVAIAYAAIALLNLHAAGQTRIERTLRSSASVATKTLILVATAIVACHLWLGLSLNAIIITGVLVACALHYYCFDPRDAEDPLSFILSIVLFLPFAPVMFLIFGRAAFRRPKTSAALNSKPRPVVLPTHLENALGVVSSPLRPTGTVTIDGKDCQAVSMSGMMIDTGTLVRVCGIRGSLLVVRENPAPA
jgi:membrane-bound ClpP family serine protease